MKQRFLSFLEEISSFIEKNKDKTFLVVSTYDPSSIFSSYLLYEYFVKNDIISHFTFLETYDKNKIESMLYGNNSYPYDIFIFIGIGGIFSEIFKNISKKTKKTIIAIDNLDPTSKAAFEENFYYISPWDFGINGLTDISLSAIVYLIIKNIYYDIRKKGYFVILDYIYELQDIKEPTGINKEILDDLSSSNLINVSKNLRYSGILDKPLYKCLADTLDIYTPKIYCSYESSLEFLNKLGINNKNPDKIFFYDLKNEEIQKLISEIVKLRIKLSENIIGNIYRVQFNDKFKDLKDILYLLLASIKDTKNIFEFKGNGTNEKMENNLISLRKFLSGNIECIIQNKCNVIEKDFSRIYILNTQNVEYVPFLSNIILFNDIIKENMFGIGVKIENKYFISFRIKKMNKEFLSVTKQTIDKYNGYFNGYDRMGGVVIDENNLDNFLNNYKILLKQNYVIV